MIEVIGVTNRDTHSLTIEVGQGSELQDLFGEDVINFRTSSSDTSEKWKGLAKNNVDKSVLPCSH